ncbi:MAG: hypothetical protein H6835_17400 [Planctomycetes bacterium]|nr:hypothetical protein [Planctomycetota bacterium]
MPDGILSHAWVGLCTIAAPCLFGVGALRRLGLPAGIGAAATLAIGYLAGHWLLAHVTAVWLLLGQPTPGFALPLLAALLGGWWLRSAAATPSPVAPLGAPLGAGARWAAAIVIAVLVAVFAQECLLANCEPIRFGDEAEIWAAKAKVLYGAVQIDPRLGMGMVAHADYPNLDPLVQVLAFASAGHTLHVENRLPIQAFGVALLLLLSAAVCRRAQPLVALSALVAASCTLDTCIGKAAYADVPVALSVLATVDALLRWRETGQRVWWRLACIAAAALLSFKNEGTMLLVAIAVPALAWWWLDRRAAAATLPRRELLWLAAPVSSWTMHQVFVRWFDLHNDLMDPSHGGGLFARIAAQASTHAPVVLSWFGGLFVDPGPHRLLPLLFGVAGLVALATTGGRYLRRPAAMLLAIVAASIGGYMLVFVGTNSDLGWHLPTAAARTMAHVVPVAALGLAMTIAPRRAPEGRAQQAPGDSRGVG